MKYIIIILFLLNIAQAQTIEYSVKTVNGTGANATGNIVISGSSSVGDSLVRTFDTLAAHNVRIGVNTTNIATNTTAINLRKLITDSTEATGYASRWQVTRDSGRIASNTTSLTTKLDSIRLVNTGILHTTPATFSLSGNTGVVTQTLATQTAYKVFSRGSGSGTPTFNTLDSNYWAGAWATQVRAAQNNANVTAKQDTGIAWLKTGNNNINAGDFIGSTNNSSLRFRMNGNLVAQLDSFSASYGGRYTVYGTNGNYIRMDAGATDNISKLDIFGSTINMYGSMDARQNAGWTLNGLTSGNDNILATRCGACGPGDIFAARVAGGTNVFNVNRSGQVGIGATSPDASAALDITSTSKGLLIPRMTTTQMNAISSPATGLMVYNTTDNANYLYNGTEWIRELTSSRLQTIDSIQLIRLNFAGRTSNGAINLNASGTTATDGINFGTTGSIYRSSSTDITFSVTSATFTNRIIVPTAGGIYNSASLLNASLQATTTGVVLGRNVADANVALTVNQSSATSTGNIAVFASTISATALTIGRSGKISTDATNTPSGTTGAQTINKPSGKVNAAAASTSLVVTNSLVTASSIVWCQMGTNDATCVIKSVVEAAGSFTINYAAPTAETVIKFWVIN